MEMTHSANTNNTVNIPLGLIPLVFENKAVNQFRVFIAIKLVLPGRVTNSKDLTKLCTATGFKKRTVLKHLDSLVSLGWVGHDKVNQTYYARAWAFLRSSQTFYNRSSVPVHVNDLKSLQPLLLTALLTQRINAQERVHNNLLKENGRKVKHFRKPNKTAANKRGSASQVHSVSTEMPVIGFLYFGLSNKSIAKMLNLSQTRACEIKSEAVKVGYITTTKRFKVLAEYEKPMPDMRLNYMRGFGSDRKNIRVSTQKRNGITYYQLVEQLYDEIQPLIRLKRINYLKMAKQKLIRSITPAYINHAA